jgi:ribosome-associated protein
MIDTTQTLPATQQDTEIEKLVQTIAVAADDRKAGDITILKVAEISYLSDYFIIVTGFSTTQVRAIADSIEDAAARECGRIPRRVEGKAEGSWILQDFGDVIVHIFLQREREFYNLEAFWGHAERIPFSIDRPGEQPL